jgi:nucleoside-diphosphate-sugar epimerase
MSHVLVTGASGFIAKHIVRELLEQGHTVRASVRSERGRAQVEALFPDAGIEFITLDLLSDAGWDEAMTGVDVLMHTASPFPGEDPKDPQDLIRPAVDGTMRALRAAHRAGVTRVVLTSSCAAIYKPAGVDPARVKTRADWTDPDGDATSPYEASKTLAERAAWDFVEEHPEMRLTVINPGAVLGPPMDEHYGTSLEYVELILGRGAPIYPQVSMPAVDVRDVARMHVGLMVADEAVGQRFPANVEAADLSTWARTLARAYPEARIPTRTAPNWLVRALATVMPPMRAAARNLGVNGEVDGSDAPRLLGFTYTPLNDSLLASAAAIRDTTNAGT